MEGCSKKTRVGKGTLVADGRPVVDTPVNGTVTAFNGTIKNGKGRYLLYVIPELSSPLVLVGTLNGNKLNIPVPPVPTLPGQPNATLTKFKLTTGAKIKVKKGKKSKTVNYLTNPKKCPSGGYAWTFQFSYENLESWFRRTTSPARSEPAGAAVISAGSDRLTPGVDRVRGPSTGRPTARAELEGVFCSRGLGRLTGLAPTSAPSVVSTIWTSRSWQVARRRPDARPTRSDCRL